MWTPTALASEARPGEGIAWRTVESQHIAATRRIVASQREQVILEEILEASKPHYQPGTAHLHYLLKTPFRYPPPPQGSRFRRPYSGAGVFYGSEAIRTSLAEFSFWRRRFFTRSPGTPLPRHPESLTVFQVRYRSERRLDLTHPPLAADHRLWTDPDDYAATWALADNARAVHIEVIRYRSVRDPRPGFNLALLSPRAFAHPKPLASQAWRLHLSETESHCHHATDPRRFFTFPVDERA